MTGEKAAREKAMSISLQTWPSAAWMTASVMGSMALMAPLPTAMRRLPMASTVAAAPGSITVVASICCTMAGPVKRAASGSFTRSNTGAVCQRPSANSGRSPITASCTLAARPAGVDQRGDGKRRPPADHRGDEVDQHRPDLRQPHLEAREVGRLEQRLERLRARRRRREGRRGSGASGRGTACRRRAARWSRRSRSAPRR